MKYKSFRIIYFYVLPLIAFTIFASKLSWSQNDSTIESVLINNFKTHIQVLAHDSLEGRATASEGEKKAAKYISQAMAEMGLEPAGYNGTYFDLFDYSAGKKINESTFLKLNGKSIELAEGYYPIDYSANGEVKGVWIDVDYGITAGDLELDSYQGIDVQDKIVLIEIGWPGNIDPHTDDFVHAELRSKIELAINNGASAVIFYNHEDDTPDPAKNLVRKISPVSIPVLFIKDHVYDKISSVKKHKVELLVSLEKIEKVGKNVVGYLPGSEGIKKIVVVGAHYDHLGYGSNGSLYTGTKAIHNGADDNASGVAMMLELAKFVQRNTDRSSNYIFIAFSGEELGLLGSDMFVSDSLIDLENVSFMFNLDMVGRMDEEEKILVVSGIGTSPTWDSLLLAPDDTHFSIVTDSSGVGPSDHTSFYLQDIPVLAFFTGTHEDYHKPSDDIDKINWIGMVHIYQYIVGLMVELDTLEPLEFTKTKENTNDVPRFTVTLGIMPNYIYDGVGLKVNGVTEGKPAYNAGLLKGDIIIKLGSYEVKDIYAYMNALSKFRAGDATTVEVERGTETIVMDLQF